MTLAISKQEEERKYWLEKLSGELTISSFPGDDTAVAKTKNPGLNQDFAFVLPDRLTEAILKLSGGADPKLFMILTAGVSGLLYKYTSHKDIWVGIPIYRQPVEGKYLNTVLTLRNRVEPVFSFKELLIRVRETIIEANKNQNYPVERLVYDLKLTGTTGQFPLFDVAVLLENVHEPGYMSAISCGLIFSFNRSDNRVEGKITYNSARYSAETVALIAGHWQNFLANALTYIDRPLSALELYRPEEKEQLLRECTGPSADYPRDKTLQQLFAEQVERTPDNIAIVGADQWPGPDISAGLDHPVRPDRPVHLSCRHLHEKSVRLAGELHQQGVGPDTLVALMRAPSLDLVIDIWGILTAGGAYLPIDPDYPRERIDYMLTDSGARVIIGKTEGPDNSALPRFPGSPSETLAYVIYTSGSTGKPKGVAIEHRNILNYVWWRIKEYGQTASDITLQFISVSFDGFGANFYPTLLTGGKLVMLHRDSWKDILSIRGIIAREKVTNFSVVPSWYRVLLAGANPGDFPGLRYVVLAGEKTGVDIITSSLRLLPGVTLINEYGPTENSVTTTAQIGMTGETARDIGKPIANTAVYILDEDLALKPWGAPGELCISSVGLARGYLNNPELTAEKFITGGTFEKAPAVTLTTHHSPLTTHHSPIYKTGDWAARMPGGGFRFYGRVDQQLKIRGARLEPGEIENCLQGHPHIARAVVLGSENDRGETYLCAYLVTAKETDILEIRNYLLKTLPEYMVPAKFVKVEQIPLTPNGKIDRKKLSETGKPMEILVEYAAPRNPVEEKLTETWKKELELEKIGIHDNYFTIGGDSIKSISLLNTINKTFAVQLKIIDLYTNPTIAQLAAKITDFSEAAPKDEYNEAVNKIEAMKKRILQGVGVNE